MPRLSESRAERGEPVRRSEAIGRLVRRHVPDILRYCDAVDHDELDRLMDASYAKRTFGINWPFCTPVEEIPAEEHRRYWTQVYSARGRRIRVSSQWFDKNWQPFAAYLMRHGIVAEGNIDAAEPKPVRKKGRARVTSPARNARYRGNAIGNAQNLVVRNILSNLGSESFSERDWVETQEYFGNRCAYCGGEGKLVIEHAIPINRTALGEHRLGNMIPACDACNRAKGQRDFRVFLEDDSEAIARIEQYMDSRNYVPLEDDEQMRMILNMAHSEVADLADRYITIINSLFASDSSSQ